jgi:hypothetical protein
VESGISHFFSIFNLLLPFLGRRGRDEDGDED